MAVARTRSGSDSDSGHTSTGNVLAGGSALNSARAERERDRSQEQFLKPSGLAGRLAGGPAGRLTDPLNIGLAGRLADPLNIGWIWSKPGLAFAFAAGGNGVPGTGNGLALAGTAR